MSEIIENRFSNIFSSFKNKKIVLYGIGQLTAKVLSNETGFQFVGLMDKDPNKVGEIVYGLPILDTASAEEMGDLIIINATEQYWDIIYKRISNCKIPVYFKNGKLASSFKHNKEVDSYWNQNEENMINELKKYEIISFDMFDTLVSRTVLRPGDIFELVEKKCHFPFAQIRNQVIGEMRHQDYSLDELYLLIGKQLGIEKKEAEKLKNLEIQIEKEHIVCRQTIMNIFEKMVEEKKDVYVVSDMYFSSLILQEILNEVGLKISKEHILVSNEHRGSKRDGKLWNYFSQCYVGGRKAIHVGDNWMSDIENPKKYGIDSYYIMSVFEMIQNSAERYMLDDAYTLEDSCRIGKFAATKFQNPFALCVENSVLKWKR